MCDFDELRGGVPPIRRSALGIFNPSGTSWWESEFMVIRNRAAIVPFGKLIHIQKE